MDDSSCDHKVPEDRATPSCENPDQTGDWVCLVEGWKVFDQESGVIMLQL